MTSMFVSVPMMRAQRIRAEVRNRIAPYRVNVIAIARGVVVLDQQTMALDAVVVRPSRFRASCPGEVQTRE